MSQAEFPGIVLSLLKVREKWRVKGDFGLSPHRLKNSVARDFLANHQVL